MDSICETSQQCSICHKLHHFAKFVATSVATNVKPLLSRTDLDKPLIANLLQKRKFMFLIRKTIFQWQKGFYQCFNGVSESSWLPTVYIEGGTVTFKPDTGAEANVLPLKVHKVLGLRRHNRHAKASSIISA